MRTFSIKITFLFLLLNTISMYGQGVIKGFVIDSLTMDKLKGVEIILTGTNFNTVSNTDGEFRITGIPAGDYIMKTSYLSYEGKKYLVNIESGKTQTLNIELLPIVTIENEMTFTTQAKSQAEEINLAISSSTIKNIISEQKLQEMPDENILLALNRLPGVSIVYRNNPSTSSLGLSGFSLSQSADIMSIPIPPQDEFPMVDDPISRVLIRGLDSRFSNITIDGVRLLSTTAKNKSIDLNILSERDYQNIELNKTVTSDEDADATAGTINIISAKAPDKMMIKAELLGNYYKLDESKNQYNFNGSYGERFLDNLLGIRASVKAEKKIISNEYIGQSLTYQSHFNSYTNGIREKYGANVLLDYNTPDGGVIRFNNIFNKIYSNYFDYVADSSLFLSNYYFTNRETEQNIFLSSVEGNNYLFGFDVNWNASFSESRNDHPYYYNLNFWIVPSYYPSAGVKLDHSIDSPSKNYVKEKTFSVDIFKRYNINDEITGDFKFGGKYRTNTRLYSEDLRAENASITLNNRYRKLADGSLLEKDFSGTRFDGLVGEKKFNILFSYFQDEPPRERTIFNEYKIPLINMDALRLWRELNYSPYYLNDGLDINDYSFEEKVFAGYLMHNLNFKQKVKFITGLRIESEQNNYSGFYFPNLFSTPDVLYNGIPEKTNTYNYDKVTLLPNVQMILKPADFLNLRLAAYKTLIRPDYNARIPRFIGINKDNHPYISMGNPELKNADVWNYEFQTQFYGDIIGLFNINAFYKDIEGMHQATKGIQLTNSGSVEKLGINLQSLPLDFPFQTGSYYIYTYYNSPKPTHMWGFEIEHQANFRYLPGLLKNIVLNYNFTFLRSENYVLDIIKIVTTTTESLIEYKKQPMDNIPKFFANVIIGYDIMGFSFRLSYFYQDKYPIVYDYFYNTLSQNKFSRLDIAVRQKILENFAIILNLNNVTNFQEDAVYGENSSITQKYRTGMNVSFGIRVNL